MGRKQCTQTLSFCMEEGAGIPQQTLEFWLVIFILSYITLKAVVRVKVILLERKKELFFLLNLMLSDS